MKFIDLVLFERFDGTMFLAEAPAWTHFEIGDSIVALWSDGIEREGDYISSITVGPDSAAFDFCIACCEHAAAPLPKVKGYRRLEELVYEEAKA